MTIREIYLKRADAVKLIVEATIGMDVMIAGHKFLSPEELAEMNGQQVELETAVMHADKLLQDFKRILTAAPTEPRQ